MNRDSQNKVMDALDGKVEPFPTCGRLVASTMTNEIVDFLVNMDSFRGAERASRLTMIQTVVHVMQQLCDGQNQRGQKFVATKPGIWKGEEHACNVFEPNLKISKL